MLHHAASGTIRRPLTCRATDCFPLRASAHHLQNKQATSSAGFTLSKFFFPTCSPAPRRRAPPRRRPEKSASAPRPARSTQSQWPRSESRRAASRASGGAVRKHVGPRHIGERSRKNAEINHRQRHRGGNGSHCMHQAITEGQHQRRSEPDRVSRKFQRAVPAQIVLLQNDIERDVTAAARMTSACVRMRSGCLRLLQSKSAQLPRSSQTLHTIRSQSVSRAAIVGITAKRLLSIHGSLEPAGRLSHCEAAQSISASPRWIASASAVIRPSAPCRTSGRRDPERRLRALRPGDEQGRCGHAGARMDGQERKCAEPVLGCGEDRRQRVGPMDHDEASAWLEQRETSADPADERRARPSRRQNTWRAPGPASGETRTVPAVEERRIGDDRVGLCVGESRRASGAGVADIELEDRAHRPASPLHPHCPRRGPPARRSISTRSALAPGRGEGSPERPRRRPAPTSTSRPRTRSAAAASKAASVPARWPRLGWPGEAPAEPGVAGHASRVDSPRPRAGSAMAQFGGEARFGQEPARPRFLVRVDQDPARQKAERSLDRGHVLVGDEETDIRGPQQRIRSALIRTRSLVRRSSTNGGTPKGAHLPASFRRLYGRMARRSGKGKRLVGVVVPLEEKPADRLIEPLTALVAADMARVNQTILSRTGSDVAMIPEVANHLISSGGKRLRPMLTLATAGCAATRGDGPHQARRRGRIHAHRDAAARRRRRRERHAARQGGGAHAVGQRGERAGRRFPARPGVQDDGRGRLAALPRRALHRRRRDRRGRGDAALRRQGHRRRPRTPISPSSAPRPRRCSPPPARSGPILAGRAKAEIAACRGYGANLGIAFQLIDDALDYGGSSAKLGKNVGDDFREGKITLPVVLSFRRGTTTSANSGGGRWRRAKSPTAISKSRSRR